MTKQELVAALDDIIKALRSDEQSGTEPTAQSQALDPGEGWRLIDPSIDEPQEGDEAWNKSLGGWFARPLSKEPFSEHITYRRRVEHAAYPDPGDGWRLIDPETDEPQEGDEYLYNGQWAPRCGWNTPFESSTVYRRRVEPEVIPCCGGEPNHAQLAGRYWWRYYCQRCGLGVISSESRDDAREQWNEAQRHRIPEALAEEAFGLLRLQYDSSSVRYEDIANLLAKLTDQADHPREGVCTCGHLSSDHTEHGECTRCRCHTLSETKEA